MTGGFRPEAPIPLALTSKIQSPQATLIPFITTEEAATLVYPPNDLPGARNGPAGGEKVLFVHGDATPCLVFSKIAQGLVDSGYRGMLFDLWGRGYSDTPLDCRHDVRPFASQITLAIAPASLLRKLPEGYEDQLMHHPEVATSQEPIREKVRQILGATPSGPALNIQLHRKRVVPLETGPSRVEKSFDMGAILQWQFDHHRGHVHSFQDTVRCGPLQGREDLWGKICDIIAGRTRPDSALHKSKLVVFFGRDDGVVVGEETAEDILKLLLPGHLQVEYLPGGHGFPYPNSEKR
ncbi:Alpha/Beta hydrolase protein [Ustulina deusta]|nr:Alpha/Beta hydrolase protein [Ustulina deusta]